MTTSRTKPFVSVVTPFYNAMPYLPECIESVLGQSYGNWEYVLANNASTDGSAEVAREYAHTETRIRLFENKSLLPQAANYNYALRQISAESKYCKIVEADNRLYPECLELLVQVAERHPTAGVVEAYHLAGEEIRLAGLPGEVSFLPGRQAGRFQLLNHPDKSIFGPPTSHLIRSDLIRGKDAFYDETSCFFDFESFYELLDRTDFGFVHQILSFVRMNNINESVTRSIITFEPYLLHSLVALKRYGPRYLEEHEYRNRLSVISSRYFKMLGRAALTKHGPEFWDYHRENLAAVGVELGPLRLARYAAWSLTEFAVSPRGWVRRLKRRIHGRHRSD